jgi:glucose dehydrogenase
MFFIVGVLILIGWRWMEPRRIPAPANARRDTMSLGALAASQLLIAMLVLVGIVPVLFPRTADGTTYSAVIAQQPKRTFAALHGAADAAAADSDWTSYGRTPGGQRYSPLDQITPKNLKELEVAWCTTLVRCLRISTRPGSASSCLKRRPSKCATNSTCARRTPKSSPSSQRRARKSGGSTRART